MKLGQTLAWIKEALGRRKVVESLSAYCFRDGYALASDGRMSAGIPCEFPATCLVPGDALEDAVSALGGDVAVSFDAGALVLRAGKARAKVQTLASGEWPGLMPGDEWLPMPGDIVPAIKRVRPFVHDNPVQQWQGAITLWAGAAWASNNVVLARGDAPSLKDIPITSQIALPEWAADFIVSRAQELESWQKTEGSVAFRWKGGAWMRTQLVYAAASEVIVRVLDSCGEAEFAITPEFRAAFRRVADVTREDSILIFADHIKGGSGKLEIADDAEGLAPDPKEGPSSAWTCKHLAAVMDAATHIQFNKWPHPTPWRGEGVRGVIAGRRH